MEETEKVNYKALYELTLKENRKMKVQMREIVLPAPGAEPTEEEFEIARRTRKIAIGNEIRLREMVAGGLQIGWMTSRTVL